MRTLESFSDETWDRFFDFLADGVDELTPEQAREELRSAGIDTRLAYERLREIIERKRREQ